MPSSANCRRAVSTTYYAIFHHLAHCCADLLVGIRGVGTSKHAWDHVYRALKHHVVSAKCAEKTMLQFPEAIQDFAILFRNLQFERERCDYKAEYHVPLSSIEGRIEQVRESIVAFDGIDEMDRRAFAVWVLVDSKRHKDGPRPERPGMKGTIAQP